MQRQSLASENNGTFNISAAYSRCASESNRVILSRFKHIKSAM